jgi:hypothetical protein
MFGFLKKKKKTSNRQLAEKLFTLSKILCHGTTASLFDQFPSLDLISRTPQFDLQRDWDFFFITATTATGLFIFADDRPDEFRPMATEVLRVLGDWNRLASDAVTDFQDFTNRNRDEGVDLGDAMGLWIVANMKQGAPDNADYPAARAIGHLIFTSLRDWHR